MQIAFHIGANCTDEDRLLRSVLQNTDVLLQRGVSVPGPGRYRKLIREAIQALDGAPPAPDARDILLDAILDDETAKRIVLSNDNFITIPKRIFDHGVFYGQAEKKVAGLRRLFPGDQLSLFLGLRNPIAFLQDTFRRSEVGSLEAYLGVLDPIDLRWSDVIKRIKLAAPETPLIVWCNEDTPLIWERLIRLLVGVDATVPLDGRFDVLSRLMPASEMEHLLTRIEAEAPDNGTVQQELIAAALDASADPGVMDDEIDLPGIDEAMIADITDSYEADLDTIAAMQGVTLVLPFE